VEELPAKVATSGFADEGLAGLAARERALKELYNAETSR
jgi:hypothetical protein